MQLNCFHNLIADRVHRRKGAHRLLKNHGNVLASNAKDFVSGRADLGDVDHTLSIRRSGRVKKNLARVNLAGRWNNTQHRLSSYSFATAALAYHTQYFPAMYGQVDSFHSAD